VFVFYFYLIEAIIPTFRIYLEGIENFYFSSTSNAICCKVIFLWVIDGPYIKFCNFISKRGQIPKFHMFGFLFFIQFWCSLIYFFELIRFATRASSSMSADFLFLTISLINSTKRGEGKPNSKIWTFSFFIQFHFLQNDHLHRSLMDHKKKLVFYIEKGSEGGPNSEIFHIWKAYLTLEIVK